MLVSENARLKASLAERKFFRIEDIQHDDKLVSSYAGFISFDVYKSFSFLGPAFNCLNYWGEKDHKRQRKFARKLDPYKSIVFDFNKTEVKP